MFPKKPKTEVTNGGGASIGVAAKKETVQEENRTTILTAHMNT